jgi:hypothetical protein
MDSYGTLLTRAVKAVKGTIFESRVRRVQLSLEYVQLQQSRYYGPEKGGFLSPDKSVFYKIISGWPQKVQNFVNECKKVGVTELSEGGLSPDAYQEEWNKIFARRWPVNLALNARVSLTNPFAEDYPAKGNRTLVDGVSGFNDFSYNWLCFYGTDMIASIDMGKSIELQTISMNFLDDPRHWIFLPASVLVDVSDDGVNYHNIGVRTNKSEEEHTSCLIVPFLFKSALPLRTRYIRVTAKALKELPSWRDYSNKKPMICCDEVYVTK